MSQSQFIRRNVSLEPRDHQTVTLHASQWGQSFSGALRFIIREWESLKLAAYLDTIREEPAEQPTD